MALEQNDEMLIVAISATPSSLSPFFATDSNAQNINRLLHVSLVELDDHMSFRCQICERFVEKNIGGKHVVDFYLKKDLLFQDGTRLSAHDVKNSWGYYGKNEKIKSTFMETFQSIESVNVISDDHVQFIYKNFSLENISNLSLLKILKFKNDKIDHLDDFKNIIGAGRYILEEVNPLDIIIRPRERNQLKIVFKVVKDETTLALKLLNREIDLSVAGMSPRKIDWLKKQKELISAWEMPSSNYIFLGLNQGKDEFKDWRIRKALSLLIPRDELLKYKLRNTVTLSNGMFSRSFNEFFDSQRLVDRYDPQEATRLFELSGFKKNKRGRFEKKRVEFSIDWKVSNNKASIEIVEVLKNYLEKFGIKVTLTVMEWGSYMSHFKSGKFDIVMGQWIGFNGPDMLRFVFHSDFIPPKGGNRIRYHNADFDRIIDLATMENDPQKRKNLYKEANKIVTDDRPYISLWHPNITWVGRSCLSDVQLEPTGSFYFFPKIKKHCEKK